MIGQFCLPQTFVSGIVFPVDVADRIVMLRELRNKAGRKHRIGSRNIPVGFFRMDDEGISHDLPQGKSGNLPFHGQNTAEKGILIEMRKDLLDLLFFLQPGGCVLLILLPEPGVKLPQLRQMLLRPPDKSPIGAGKAEFVHMVPLSP